MRRIAAILLVSSAALLLGWRALARRVPGPSDGGTLLSNGWRLTPAGRMIPAGSFPLNLVVAPDGRLLAVASGYARNGVIVLDPARGAVIDTVPMSSAWLGLAMGRDTTAFVSGGLTNRVYALRMEGGRWVKRDSLVLADSGAAIFPAGLSLAPDGRTLAVAGNLADSIYLLGTAPLRRIAAAGTGSHPYTALFARDGRTVFVSNWGDSTVAVFRAEAGALRAAGVIAVPPRPSALALTGDGRRLFVAHAGANAVAVVDPEERRVEATIALGLTPRAPEGSGPNALALAPDGRTLYVANADNNAVAVVALEREGGPRVTGFIPTGWYPTAVALSADGRTLFVANGKGAGSLPNPRGLHAPGSAGRDQYIGNLLTGSVSVIAVPGAAALRAYTRQVLENSPYRDALLRGAAWPRRSPIPRNAGERSPIRYVVYVIKENRTYDQVFGDVAAGNGEPSLAIFGDSVTPNQHALARQFVLFDNFYVDGDVSADGHLWSTAAYASDYDEKTWPAVYGHDRPYDLDAGLPVNDPLAGYLWDAVRRAGLTLRNYGEMTQWDSATARATPSPPGLVGVTDERYPGFVMAIPDTARAGEFIRELEGFERAGEMPRLVILYLPRDHTEGLRAGRPTPRAMVADNDLALGRVVEALSRSPFWPAMAVFVLEDDAQDGPDHVDAHRSPMLALGPYVRHGVVDSTFYTTASVLRTIELILGLPPLSQYDAGATPLFPAFTTRPDPGPFTARPPTWPLDARNPPRRASLDPRTLERPDLADEEALNREIWASVRGERAAMPAPRHAPLLAASRSPTGRAPR